MATNIIRDDDSTMVIEAVGAAYDSGAYIAQGLMGGISLNTVLINTDAVVQYKGEVSYAKTAGSAWTEGDELFFDSGNNEFTNVATTDGIVRGYAAADALLAATTGLVTLCEGHYTAAGAFVTYDNSTSGLAATTVQDAIDEVEDRVDDLESDKMDLVATPTAGNLIEMDAAGQGVDSGVATADVQVLTVPAAGDNLAGLNDAGALTDSGIAAAVVQVLTVPAVAGNLAELDAQGALADSGVASADIAGAITMGALWGDNARNSTNTTQAVADSTATDVAFENVEVTGDVTVNVGNTEFTIPTTGVYTIAFMLTFDTAAGGTTRVANLLVNGDSRGGGEETPSGTGPVVVEDYSTLYLVATDVVKLAAFQDSGTSLNVTAGRIAIQRIQ